MSNKKGVSDIVTTVLIILLVLAAVTIVGNILLKNLNKGGTQIQEATECLSLDIQPTACIKNSANNYSVQYKWIKGSDVKLTGVKVAIYDERGLNIIVEGDKPSSVGSVQEVMINTTALKNAEKSATVAGVIQSETGNVVPCTESPIKVDCEAS